MHNIRQTLCFSEPWRPIFSMLPLIRVQVPYHVPHALTYKAASVARHESIAKPWEPVEMHLVSCLPPATNKISSADRQVGLKSSQGRGVAVPAALRGADGSHRAGP